MVSGRFSGRQVLATAGAAEANFIAYWTLMRPGDAIALMLNWRSCTGWPPPSANKRPFSLVQTADGWKLDTASLAAATRGGARLIAVCNPNNPTGAILDEGEMTAIVEAARACDAWILSDEIYRGSELDGRPETPSFHGLYNKVIVTSSTSKSLAHAGLRPGWVVALEAMISELVERQDYTTIGTGLLNQFLAAPVSSRPVARRSCSGSRTIIAANLEIIAAWIEAWNGGVSWRRPQAGGMAFVAYDFNIGSTEPSRVCARSRACSRVAGDWFGMDRHLRLGAGGEAETLKEGLRRIDQVFGELSI